MSRERSRIPWIINTVRAENNTQQRRAAMRELVRKDAFIREFCRIKLNLSIARSFYRKTEESKEVLSESKGQPPPFIQNIAASEKHFTAKPQKAKKF
jgi:hypothetical protein